MSQPNPSWFAIVKVGDVIRFPGDVYRVVRHVSRWHSARRGVIDKSEVAPLRGLTFTIRRPSWTRRCYTILTASDLKSRRAEYVGARIKLVSEMDAKIAKAITDNEFPPHYTLYANDVRGVA